MEKFGYDYESFGLGSCKVELKPYIVYVDGIDFNVYPCELREFIDVCLGSGLDVQIKSANNDFLMR